MEHAHPKYKANEDDILAEQISRQQKVLSTIPKAETKKRKNTKKEKCKAPLFSEPTEEMSVVSKNSDMEEHTPKPKKRRLGMTGPAFTKFSLSINVSDVSIELEIPKEQNVVETCISEGKQVV